MLEKSHEALGCAHLVGVGVRAGGYKNWEGRTRAQKYKRPVFVQLQPAALGTRQNTLPLHPSCLYALVLNALWKPL